MQKPLGSYAKSQTPLKLISRLSPVRILPRRSRLLEVAGRRGISMDNRFLNLVPERAALPQKFWAIPALCWG